MCNAKVPNLELCVDAMLVGGFEMDFLKITLVDQKISELHQFFVVALNSFAFSARPVV